MLGMGNGVSAPPSSGTFYDLNSHPDLAFYFKNNTQVSEVQWNDQSGNNNHAAQESGPLQGTPSGGGMLFDGEDNYYNKMSDHEFYPILDWVEDVKKRGSGIDPRGVRL